MKAFLLLVPGSLLCSLLLVTVLYGVPADLFWSAFWFVVLLPALGGLVVSFVAREESSMPEEKSGLMVADSSPRAEV